MPLVRIDLRKQKDSASRQQIDRDVDGALVVPRGGDVCAAFTDRFREWCRTTRILVPQERWIASAG